MNIPEKLFITGTDTGIGKTVASAMLALGMGAKYWKPMQTGIKESSDSNFVETIIGKEKILPEAYALQEPLSPMAAAAFEEVSIDRSKLLAMAHDFLAEKIIIEGAGGLLVPIAKNYCMIDFIFDLSIPVVLVARSSLGTINHTLLSLEALQKRKIAVYGIILVGEENKGNKRAIEEFSSVSVIAEIPWLSTITRENLLDIYGKFFRISKSE